MPVPMLSEPDKERVRYHLGYLETYGAASIAYGIPTTRPTLFILENAMQLLQPLAIPRVLWILAFLDRLERTMQGALCSLAAEQLGNLKLRADQLDRLEWEYNRWTARLADIFGAPRYQYSLRFSNQRFGEPSAGNIGVNNSVNIRVRR